MKAKIGNIEIEGTPEECKTFLNNSSQENSLRIDKSDSCSVVAPENTNNKETKEEYYGHKKEVMKDYDNGKM